MAEPILVALRQANIPTRLVTDREPEPPKEVLATMAWLRLAMSRATGGKPGGASWNPTADDAFRLRKALAVLCEMDAAGRRVLPDDAPTGFIRRAWRPFVIGADGKPDRRAWEVCVLSELRDRLRAGDVWVRGSRRYRNFEDLLLPQPTFTALRAEGPLPVGVPEDLEAHLASRREVLETAMAEVAALAKAGRLPDATLDADGLRITPLRAEGPPEARRLAADAYALLPRIRITDLLLEVDGWTGFSACFRGSGARRNHRCWKCPYPAVER